MTTMHDNDGHEDDDDDNDGDDDYHDIYSHDHDISLTWLTAGWSSAHTYDCGMLPVSRLDLILLQSTYCTSNT